MLQEELGEEAVMKLLQLFLEQKDLAQAFIAIQVPTLQQNWALTLLG